MIDRTEIAVSDEIFYPESDGKPMADNTRQFEWIVTIEGGLDALFADNPDVFVAGDLLWYPVKGHPEIRIAPDAMVVFGRPKGHRGSYKQWEEGNIAPQVVFEVLSPSNTRPEMLAKRDFYQRYGVEEFYIYDPDRLTLEGWHRQGHQLQLIPNIQGWVSPRLGVRFELSSNGDLIMIGPDGRIFVNYIMLSKQRNQAEQLAEQERQRAEQERLLAEQERQRAEQERLLAEQERQVALQERQKAEQERQRAEQEKLVAEQERQKAEQERLAKERAWARLRELGIDPENL